MHGPAGATLATLKRLNWQANSANEWTTDIGQNIDLRKGTGPRTLKKIIDESVGRWQLRQLNKHEELQVIAAHQGPAVKGIKQAIKHFHSKEEWAEAGGPRSTVIGAQWPEARLHAAGLSPNDLCQRCLECPGTLLHRHLESQKVAPETVPPMIQQLQGKLGGATRLPELLLSRGLCPLPTGTLPAATATLETTWEVKHGDPLFVGDVYTDGSGLYPTDPTLRRTGFSAVQLDSENKVRAVVYGPGFHRQEVGAAEIFAAITAIRHSAGKIRILTDYQGLVDGFKNGQKHTISAKHSYSEVWREFWEAAADVGPDLARKKSQQLAKQVGIWIGRRAANANTEPRDCSGKKKGRARAQAEDLTVTHDVVPLEGSPGWWHCRQCESRAISEKTLKGKRCHGRLHVTRGAHLTHNLLCHPGFAFCTGCGYHATHHNRMLASRCTRVGPDRQPLSVTGGKNLAKISQGIHPLTKAKLAGSAAPVPRERPPLGPVDFGPPDTLTAAETADVPPVPAWDVAEVDPFDDLAAWLDQAGEEDTGAWFDEGPVRWEDGPWLEPP